ncbi:MAG: hypothetical protein D6713_03630 [Deltaproteobacteria bacterium]|nr:MAG: hypothetical protein D6713_03630 [Deltaproteobacteria bacterium]
MHPKVASLGKAAAKKKALAATWTFPTVVATALLIAWAAEAAQFLVSQGLALALLAWLQTLPEFMVEAVIAWEQKVHLMVANLTGSIRLLIGLGWPMIFFTKALLGGKNLNGKRFGPIVLMSEHSVEVIGVFLPSLYFLIIFAKGTLTLFDALLLFGFYVYYLYILYRIPPVEEEGAEDLPWVPAKILTLSKRNQVITVAAMFLAGGVVLLLVASPFLHSMMGLAVTLGVSEFVFVQWVAPFLSEFPEKLSAFYWARTGKKASMAMINLVSSVINQWTVLPAMMVVVYSVSRGEVSTVVFDHHQRVEILLTIAQSFLASVFLLNMKMEWFEAVLLFLLWFVQFVLPHTREEMVVVYFLFVGFEVLRMFRGKRSVVAVRKFGEQYRNHVRKKGNDRE